MGRDKRDGQRAGRMNGNLQLSRVGGGDESLGSPRELEWGRLPEVSAGDHSRDGQQQGYGI